MYASPTPCFKDSISHCVCHSLPLVKIAFVAPGTSRNTWLIVAVYAELAGSVHLIIMRLMALIHSVQKKSRHVRRRMAAKRRDGWERIRGLERHQVNLRRRASTLSNGASTPLRRGVRPYPASSCDLLCLGTLLLSIPLSKDEPRSMCQSMTFVCYT